MGKKPLIGVVGFFGLSLALAGCSDGGSMFTRENGPPWKNSLARNGAKNEGWKDAPKAGEATATATTTDPYKATKPASIDAGNVPTNTLPTNTVTDVGNRTANEFPSAPAQAPMTAGMQPPNGALPADVGMNQTPPVAATPMMRPPDDGLRAPSLPPAPKPVIREVYTPQVNTQPSTPPALEEPPMPSAPKPGFSPSPRSLPEIKGAAHDSLAPPPPAPPAMDPMLAAPPPPLPAGVKAPGTALEGVPPLPAPPTPTAPTAPALDPVPPPPAPVPPLPTPPGK